MNEVVLHLKKLKSTDHRCGADVPIDWSEEIRLPLK